MWGFWCVGVGGSGYVWVCVSGCGWGGGGMGGWRVGVHAHVHVPYLVCRGQRTTAGIHFLLPPCNSKHQTQVRLDDNCLFSPT